MYSHWRLFPMALVGHHRPVKKRRNNVLAQTYYWGICAYTVYAYMCVWMPIYAFSADANYFTVYFGSLISELYCNMVTFMLVVMFRPLVFVADSLLRLAQSGSNNIVHVKETILCDNIVQSESFESAYQFWKQTIAYVVAILLTVWTTLREVVMCKSLFLLR